MNVHLVDGTYELFRHFYGLRRFTKGKDRPYGAVVGVPQTVLQMIENGDTYLGVAPDHVIESFRNRLWATFSANSAASHCSSRNSRPCAPTRHPSKRSKRCAGAVRRRHSRSGRSGWKRSGYSSVAKRLRACNRAWLFVRSFENTKKVPFPSLAVVGRKRLSPERALLVPRVPAEDHDDRFSFECVFSKEMSDTIFK
jgi:hypothetical protein